ncbi:hypothetical protein KR018_010607 [Drosophila ironensis]|nr:hypothetical protein KR018_010607 [Drosophila ironensis]
MLKTTIADTHVRLVASQTLLDFLDKHKQHFPEVPEKVARLMKEKGYTVPLTAKIVKGSQEYTKRPTIDHKLLNKLTADVEDRPAEQPLPEKEEEEKPRKDKQTLLFIEEISWLNDTLIKLREQDVCEVFLHELIQTCDLILPQNEYTPRNPELEARCQKLREEQQNRDYQKMTKNVDAGLKNYPEDTISYQLKSLNKQIIAVVQFIFSVAAGFTFGFFGVNLMVGPLPFGFRLLLGVIVALIIALAEMYFLAKKLHEYDEVLDGPKRRKPATPTKATKPSDVEPLKPHAD